MTATAVPTGMSGPYPVSLEVNSPVPQGRWGVFFRLILAIPHLIIVRSALSTISAVLAILSWFAIVFTGKYPQGLAALAAGCLRWDARALGYALLLTDKYPPFSFDQEPGYAVRSEVPVQLENRNRWTTGFRPILIIPSLVILMALTVAAVVVYLIAWVAGTINGSVPDRMHQFLTGWLRWWLRLSSYAYVLVDPYPPFSLS